MMNNYSFWKLLLRQWSWSNDKEGVYIFLAISFAHTVLIAIFNDAPDNYYVLFCIWLLFTLCPLIAYHLLKLIIFFLVLGLVSFFAKKGENEAISIYKEAWSWRQ